MLQTDEQLKIANEYFEWMYSLVCNTKHYNSLSYRKLLYFLHSVNFYAVNPNDQNRLEDGISLRYKFAAACGYSYSYVEENLDIRECSVLEMMVSLAYRGEQELMANTEYGDRTGQWFWAMIVNLGLGHMTDDKFDKDTCAIAVYNFLNRRYSPDGRGGLFTLATHNEDLRYIEIWDQFMWYLIEMIDN